LVRSVHVVPVVGVLALAALLAAISALAEIGGVGWAVGLGCARAANALLAVALRRSATPRFGPANVVTLSRVVLGQVVAALVAASFAGAENRRLLVCVTLVALALDFVDGRVARHTGSVSDLGARFDMEADAFLILVLSVAAAPLVGEWVLLIGAARYALFGAERVWVWLRAPVPRRYWRKVVAAIQGITLTVAVADVLPLPVATVALVVSLGLLAESFGRDVRFLARSAARRPARQPALFAETVSG
jgi:phosphatidylglycerophosphate synthase